MAHQELVIGGFGNKMAVPTLSTYSREELVDYALSQYTRAKVLQEKVWALEEDIKKRKEIK